MPFVGNHTINQKHHRGKSLLIHLPFEKAFVLEQRASGSSKRRRILSIVCFIGCFELLLEKKDEFSLSKSIRWPPLLAPKKSGDLAVITFILLKKTSKASCYCCSRTPYISISEYIILRLRMEQIKFIGSYLAKPWIVSMFFLINPMSRIKKEGCGSNLHKIFWCESCGINGLM